ncbi:MAG: hypothetical protein V2J89_14110, partial [Halieaceae bacterium]|nr:hypothetical protein [Halieaceae bacterium]
MVNPAKLLASVLCTTVLLAGCSDGNDSFVPPDGGPGEGAGQPVDITILHMNDHHSHVLAEDFDYDVSGLSLTETTEAGAPIAEVEVTYGGFPAMVSLF